MGFSEESEKKLQKHHHDLCKTLNLDKGTSNETWKTFKKVYDKFVLEGDPLHWLGCALYVSCKTSTTPSVSKSNVVIQGNQVSLVQLLRATKLSHSDFFIKIRKWVSLQELQPELKDNIIKLEHIFNVSMVLFKKFKPIFDDMFNTVPIEQNKNHKSKKLRQPLPTIEKIYEFTWTLFLCVKSNFPNIVDDLVHLYPLLLSCCDCIYANAVLSGRKDIVKENLLSSSPKAKYNDIADVPSIIDKLCSLHDGIVVDVMKIKEYCWRKEVRVLFKKSLLKGNPDLLSGILDVNTFDHNLKSIKKVYEEFVLSTGSIDERDFVKSGEKSESDLTEADKKRKSLGEKDSHKKNYSDGDIATIMSLKSGPTLKSLLLARPSGPGENLKQLKCASSLEKSISNTMSKLFNRLVKITHEEDPNANIRELENVTNLVKKMFYKLLDSIFSEEVKKPEFDPDRLLSQEIFIMTLFACAFEIISFSMNLNKNFPWILETIDVTPFHFYRIIEVVVRNEDALKRDVVRHLNNIEESILESLAWKNDSPLWKALIESRLSIPSSEDVIVPPIGEERENAEIKIDVLAGKTINLTLSPGAPLADKFLSPNRNKRPISEVNNASESEPLTKILRINNENNKDKRIAKPRRTGSISLFFRKFYYLASVRLKDMCSQLRLTNLDLKTKIWTCFEKTIVQNVSLMLDRHLDQMLMCAIYVMCKIVAHDLTFMDMMKCYRNQPQAQSHVYRNVLIKPNVSLEEIEIKSEHAQEERGDIIKFYNEVYIHKVKEFAKKFKNPGDSEMFALSPIPVKKGTPVNGPKRVSESLPIYVSRPKRYMSPNSNPLKYNFARSPAKDLQAINMMVSHETIPSYAIQPFNLNEDTSNNSSGTLVTRRVRDLFADRLTMTSQEVNSTSK